MSEPVGEQTLTDLAQIPTPAGAHAPTVPADLMAMAETIDPLLNLVAADEADRDAKYSEAPAGTQVSTPDGWQWVKISTPPDPAQWLTLASVESTTGITWEQDWNDDGTSILTRTGRVVDCFLSAIYQGPTVEGTVTTFLEETRVGQTPTGWSPKHPMSFVASDLGAIWMTGFMYATGSVYLRSLRNDATLQAGVTLRISLTWIQ